MKKRTVILASVVVLAMVFAFAGSGCAWVDVKVGSGDEAATDESSDSTEDSSTEQESSKSTRPEEAPKEIALGFLNASLGTMPDSNLNESVARGYLTEELRDEYDNDPSFIPTKLCIQQGPENIAVGEGGSVTDDAAIVEIQARYGSDWQDMWDFNLVAEDGEWKIDSIDCTNDF